MIDVSIIIVNYNTYDLTCSCIRSIIEKTKDVSYEIILVDNSSIECAPLIFQEEFPTVQLVQNVVNLGFAGGNNSGIAKSTGRYILLLNSDTELLNDAVSIAVGKMKKDSSIGALSGQLQYPEGAMQAVAGRFPSIKNELREFFRLRYFESQKQINKRLLGGFWNYSQPIEADWVWGAFFMFPREILEHFPGKRLHEDFFMYYEDVLWCYYIKKKLGLKIMYTPEPILIHHISGSSINKDLKESFFFKILPNQKEFLIRQHGKIYARFYYLIKGLHLLSLRKVETQKEAKVYLGYAFSN